MTAETSTKWLLATGHASCGESGCRTHRRYLPTVIGFALVVFPGTGGAARAEDCPPETFDYGPACLEQAAQIVVCHHMSGGPMLPDPAECARAARDLGLIGVPDAVSCGYEPNELLIEVTTPEDPDLVCMNHYYQVTSFDPAYGNTWFARFPRAVNLAAVAATYLALPAVLQANVNSIGGDCGPTEMYYAPLPNGTWHWTVVGFSQGHAGCRVSVRHRYITESGKIMGPGDLNCDGAVDGQDVPLFVEVLVGSPSFSGCDPYPADVNNDGASDGADVQKFIKLLTA